MKLEVLLNSLDKKALVFVLGKNDYVIRSGNPEIIMCMINPDYLQKEVKDYQAYYMKDSTKDRKIKVDHIDIYI